MSDLVAFLRARLDEDEQTAKGAVRSGFAPDWAVFVQPPRQDIRAGNVPIASGAESVLPHIARHDPARVLREVDAIRRLIGRGGALCTSDCDNPEDPPRDPATKWATPLEHHTGCLAYEAARALAVSYADHEEYRPEWRP